MEHHDKEKKHELLELSFEIHGLTTKGSLPVFLKVNCTSHNHTYTLSESEHLLPVTSMQFKKRARIDYLPKTQQTLKIQLTQASTPPTVLSEASVDISTIVGNHNGTSTNLISSTAMTGVLIIDRRFIKDEKKSFDVAIGCLNIQGGDLFGNADPFVRLYRPYDSHISSTEEKDVPETMWILLYQTEYKKRDQNPKFRAFSISSWDLCRGNPDTLLRVELWDRSKIGRHRKLGQAYTTVQRIACGTDKFLNLFSDNHKFAGTVTFPLVEEKKSFILQEYVSCGVHLRVYLAVDCTASTLLMHNIEPNQPPDVFETAIKEVGEILQKTENNQKMGFLGFGAKIKGMLYPTFSFNMNEANPSVSSAKEALEIYRKVFPTLKPDEPTYMAPVIAKILTRIKHQDKRNKKIYTLYVILTDGQFLDKQECIDLIVELSYEPVSIVFVGIGSSHDHADFSDLEFLEIGFDPKTPVKTKGDLNKLPRRLSRLSDSKGKEGMRTIVKFIYYDNYVGKHRELEQILMKDVHKQMTEYYNSINFKPSEVEASKSEDNSPVGTPTLLPKTAKKEMAMSPVKNGDDKNKK